MIDHKNKSFEAIILFVGMLALGYSSFKKVYANDNINCQEKNAIVRVLCEKEEICLKTLGDVYFYRWGNKIYERQLIGKSPAFDIEKINFGRTALGKGLYVGADPQSILNYAPLSDAELVQVKLAKGSFILRLDRNEISILKKNGVSLKDIQKCDPPYTIKFNRNSQNQAYVLKDPRFVRVEEFTGEHLDKEQLYQLMLAAPNPQIRELIFQKIKPILHKTVFWSYENENRFVDDQANEVSPQCLRPEQNISSNNTLFSYLGRQTIQHQWHYDGSCHQYRVLNNLDEYIAEAKDLNLCRQEVPTMPSWSFDGQCYETVRGAPLIRVQKLLVDQCDKLPLYCESIMGEKRNRFRIMDVLKPTSLLSYQGIYKNFNECEKQRLIMSANALNCIVEDNVMKLVSLEGIISSSLENNNQFSPDQEGYRECREAIGSYQPDLKLACTKKMNKKIILIDFNEPMNPLFHQKISQNLNFSSIGKCKKFLYKLANDQVEKKNRKLLKEIQKKREKEHFKAEEFADLLRKENHFLKIIKEVSPRFPHLGNLFLRNAQVHEGYSVLEHTERVLQKFQEQSPFYDLAQMASRYPQFPHFLPLLQTMILLHDIGKPLAMKKIYQHESTQPILDYYLQLWHFTAEERALARTLAIHDDFGEMVKGIRKVDDVAEKLTAKASELKISAVDLFHLQTLFYISDSSSYPVLLQELYGNGKGKLAPQSAAFHELAQKFVDLQ